MQERDGEEFSSYRISSGASGMSSYRNATNGSVLGLTLFVICTNNLFDNIKTKARLFAYDTML